MARQRIRDTSTNRNFCRVQGHRGHIDKRLAPNQMRIADPNVAVAELLAEFCKVDHSLQRFRGKQTHAEFHSAHLLSSCDCRRSLRWRCLLAPASHLNLPV